ncbi:MAG TPA: cysteine peptidase family C39 domain-containing protein [Planctomycetaceae bacterium]|nr:cysteine peptidase family C39 domain-containing protein [Planctomycetaceae bacterium]
MTAPDLMYGFGVMTGISGCLFLLGILVAEHASKRINVLILILTLATMGVYLYYLWDDILLAKLLPFSNLIVVGNWLPPLAGFLAGVAWKSMPGSLRRRNLYAVVMLVISLIAMVEPVWGTTPECNDAWDDFVCRQTSETSCSAAAAATLLRLHGIVSTEQEMAELCLTQSRGTSWQGLYRGLCLKTIGTDLEVEVLSCSARDLVVLNKSPLILVVGIPKGVAVDPIYTEEYQWGVGDLHSVVFLGFERDGSARIADPEVGVETWSWEDLNVLVRGRAIRLVHRVSPLSNSKDSES